MTAGRPLTRLLLWRWPLLIGLSLLGSGVTFYGLDHPRPDAATLAQGAWVAICALLLLHGTARYDDRPISVLAVWSLASAATVTMLALPRLPDTAPGDAAAMALGVGTLVFTAASLRLLLITCSDERRGSTWWVLALVLVTSLAPLWLGPAAELFATRQPIVDLIVASSPLSYLASLISFDYLRSDWFYQHTSFGALRYDYPSPQLMTLIYLTIAVLALTLSKTLSTRRRQELGSAGLTLQQPKQEVT